MSAVQGANAMYLVQPPPPLNETYSGATNWGQVLPRKPVRPAQSIFDTDIFANGPITYIDAEITELQKMYILPEVESIRRFMALRHAVLATLIEAVPQLRASFGRDCIFSLELSTDEEGFPTLYALAVWNADVQSAASAFDRFLEDWWLHRMNAATSDLAFAYKLV